MSKFPHTPPKAYLSNMDTGEIMNFQFNPPEFTEAIGVNYARHTVPGLSHQVLQYINTNNNSISLSIYMSSMYPVIDAGANPGGSLGAGMPQAKEFDLSFWKNYLQSLLYPVNVPSGGWGAPPLLLFVWPKVVRMVCVVTDISFAHQRFAHDDLETIAMVADITLEEIVQTQRRSNFVRGHGSLTNAGQWSGQTERIPEWDGGSLGTFER